MNKLVIEYLPEESITPYINNSRVHSQEQIGQIKASIKEFGMCNAIGLHNGSIVFGHARFTALKQLGYTEFPTVDLSHLSEAQKKAYIIADNQLALNADYDNDLLKIEIEGLQELDFDIDLLGFDDDFIDGLMDEPVEGLTDEDAIPETPEEPITKLGDVWMLGRHRLVCGDSTSIDAVEKLMDGNKADMVFTDPPYGMHLDCDWSDAKSNSDFAKEKNALGGKKHRNVIGDHDDFTPKLINTVFDNFGYCKEIFLWGADYYSEYLQDKNNGSWVVWDKRLDESADKMYGSTFELCWSKAKHKRMLARVKWAGIFGTEQEFDHKRHHPTQKPTKLIEWFFDYWSVKGKNKIVDLYGGSGSTLIACEKTNRNCYMMELDPRYVQVILKRWMDYTGKIAMLESSGQEFKEVV